jgi:recombination protein RecR
MNPAYTKSLNELVEQFAKLPGIGSKTAERLAFYILKAQKPDALALAHAISDVKTNIHQCRICYNLAETEVCSICSDVRREQDVICVVEQPKDVVGLEKTGLCKWTYHILNGHIAPLEGIEPDDLTIDALIKRVRDGNIKEVVMATNPNLEGDGTSLYIHSLLHPLNCPPVRPLSLPAAAS